MKQRSKSWRGSVYAALQIIVAAILILVMSIEPSSISPSIAIIVIAIMFIPYPICRSIEDIRKK